VAGKIGCIRPGAARSLNRPDISVASAAQVAPALRIDYFRARMADLPQRQSRTAG
jgi:hypothetical protein